MSEIFPKYLLSVIVPVYNVEEFLAECLDSVLAHKIASLEIIIVDDATKDNSKLIYNKYIDKYQNISLVVHKVNKAQGGARNTGMQKAKGKFLLFLDSDDLMYENSLGNIVKYLQNENKQNIDVQNIDVQNIDIIAAKRQFFTPTKTWIPKYINNIYKQKKITTLKQNPQLLQDIYVCNKIWRKKFLQQNQIKFRENCIYEDIDFYVLALAKAEKILLTDQIITKVRRYRSGSTTTVMQSAKIKQMLQGYEIALKHIEHEHIDYEQTEIIQVLLNRLLLNFIKPFVIPGFYIAQKDKKLRKSYYLLIKQKFAYYKKKRTILKQKYNFHLKSSKPLKTSILAPMLDFLFNIVYRLPQPLFDLFCHLYVKLYRLLLRIFGFLR